jgi:hypothetical protein
MMMSGLSGSTTFFNIFLQAAWFSEESSELKMCFDFLYNVCIKHFPLKKNSAT